MGKENGENGPPRNLAEPHGTWRGPTGQKQEGITPPDTLSPVVFALSPPTHTHTFEEIPRTGGGAQKLKPKL